MTIVARFVLVGALLLGATVLAALKADGDGEIDLNEAAEGLRTLTGSAAVHEQGEDIDRDRRVGSQEEVFVLRV